MLFSINFGYLTMIATEFIYWQMELLTFAHRGEAKSFLKKDNFVSVPFYFDGLYKNNNQILLIHGEGIQSTTEKLSLVLGAFGKEIQTVVNLGACGSLKKERFVIGSIVQIRTCYRESEFKSYSTSNGGVVDIICTNERVINRERSQGLCLFAPLVDRESWAVGSVCNTLNKKFYCFKYISDDGESEDLCRSVSSRADEVSAALYQHFIQTKIEKENNQPSVDLPGSVSQKRIFQSLQKKIRLKKINYPINLNKITNKKEMAITLKEMEQELYPFEHKLRKTLMEITQGKKMEIRFSTDLEDPSILVSFSIKDRKDLAEIISELHALPVETISDLLNGKINV